jgi:epoxyqueuosine reductase
MKKLLNIIENLGWRGQIVAIDHLDELRFSILNRLEQGLIDKKLYQEQLSFFSFDPPPDLLEVRSILIVAVPTPQIRIFFHSKGKRVPVIIPPTYVSYSPRTNRTQDVLSDLLKQDGYHLAKPQLPLKTLAVNSGLAKYGRNNICYVDGMGSFLQLVGAFSDLPCDNDHWQRPRMLDRCKTCTACTRSCPTKAISTNRFLLHAENCLTFHNEASGDFPSWINTSWHHCLIGCLRCQTVCPENKEVIEWFENRAEFSELETTLFVKDVPFEQLPKETVNKIKTLEINENYHNLCRNLKLILN